MTDTKEINEDLQRHAYTLLKKLLKTRQGTTFILSKTATSLPSFYAGNLDMQNPYYICFVPKFEKIAFSIEGKGTSVAVEADPNQPECTFKPVIVTEEGLTSIMDAGGGACTGCPNDEAEARATRTC